MLKGYSGRAAHNGREALKMLRGRTMLPKLIILDLVMPVLDGWGFLRERSRDPRLVTVPVIMVSATPGIEAQARLLERKRRCASRLRLTISFQ
jgi:CheY-like chemotaxis protein